jgi:hypothetical protein
MYARPLRKLLAGGSDGVLVQYLADVQALRAEISDCQVQAHRINREEILFGYKPTSFVSLHSLKDHIEPHVTLWQTVCNWQTWQQDWLCVPPFEITLLILRLAECLRACVAGARSFTSCL